MTFWRKKQIAEKVEKDISEPYNTEPVKGDPPEPAYQVGKTEDGRVTLRLGGQYGFSTLTMTDAGVDNLIRMLEAAKEPKMDTSNEVTE